MRISSEEKDLPSLIQVLISGEAPTSKSDMILLTVFRCMVKREAIVLISRASLCRSEMIRTLVVSTERFFVGESKLTPEPTREESLQYDL